MSTIRFKVLTLEVEDGKEEEFIKELDELLDKKTTNKKSIYHDWIIEL
jgi:hypothetical protein